MSDDVACPVCDKEYGSPRAFYSHWGHADDGQHTGESPEIEAELEFSEEHRQKISENRSGIPHTEETKQKISETLEGTEAWSKGLTKEDDERVMNRSKALKGHEKTKEHIRNHAEAVREAWERGAYEDREIDFPTGEDHPHYKHGDWVGQGIEYPNEFNKQLKEKIRERDNRVCQVCGQSTEQRKLDVHHTDGNRENCNKDNLISLCRPCHGKMNTTPKAVQRMAYSIGPNPDWLFTGRVV